jgi:pyruvate-formate lyase
MANTADLDRVWQPPAISDQRYARWLEASEDMTALALDAPERPALAREAAVSAIQIRAGIDDPQVGDRCAIRWAQPPIGISPEPGGYGWYANTGCLEALASYGEAHGDRDGAARWRVLIRRWDGRRTNDGLFAAAPAETTAILPPGPGGYSQPGSAFPLARLAGCQLDHQRLMELGLPGLRALVEQGLPGADGTDASIFEAWLSVCDGYADAFAHVAEGAETAAAQADDTDSLQAFAADARHLMTKPPVTLAQAVQLLWLWDTGAGVLNHGRLYDDLAPFLAAGPAAEQEADALLTELWQPIAERGSLFDGRICLGGAGRRQQQEADRLARIALRVTARHDASEPQVSLRIDDQQDPTLLDLALDSLAEGRTYPILYWDAQVIPHVAAAHGIDEATATRWLPYGCGETVLNACGTTSPNGIANAARQLLEVLFGHAPGSRQHITAADLRTAPDFPDMEHLWSAYEGALSLSMEALAAWQGHSYDYVGDQCAFLPLSLLTDDCLSRGKPVLAGGVRYRSGTMELYGLADAGDSLAVLEQLAFGAGGCGLHSLRQALIDDFVGNEQLLARVRRVATYGNDDPAADRWTRRVHGAYSRACRDAAPRHGLDHFLVVVINNWVNTVMGRQTGALPSGCRAGKPLANGNGPQDGRDREGPVALLRSLAGLEPGLDAGCVQHLKLGRSWFSGDRAPLKALLAGYAAVGGMQVMITTSDPGELQAAMERPQDFGHLMVRVGGFSARFVDLPPDCQEEICARSLH